MSSMNKLLLPALCATLMSCGSEEDASTVLQTSAQESATIANTEQAVPELWQLRCSPAQRCSG